MKIGYLAQQFGQFNKEERLIEAFRRDVSMTEYEARHMLAQFLFYGHDVFKKVEQLSGGEKMRLRLAQLMVQQCNVLVLDEPTNHLDIESREALEEAIEKFDGTIVAISHDRYFLQKLFTKTAWLENQQLTLHDGPFEWAKIKQKKLYNE
ncbi:ATP-binding cassette domain-containing protein [Rummeliibacillus sp. G93]|uniref:ATP-binding cassette domain-containing protein n=1 Tax=Rummeliibacillus sp. G93 TaxID=2939494 RepID=UPI0021134182|nr:ATP-binding cassette domain-containing protein [Rummeliibacillus sp. G93]